MNCVVSAMSFWWAGDVVDEEAADLSHHSGFGGEVYKDHFEPGTHHRLPMVLDRVS